MKSTKQFLKFRSLMWTLLAVLLIPALSSCRDNEEDLPVNELSSQLTGLWYAEYARSGSVQLDGQTSGSFTNVVQAIRFNADGTGQVYKFYFDGDLNTPPVAMFGGELDQSNGTFTYTSTAQGLVTLMRNGSGNADNPQTWTLHYTDGQLTGTDAQTAVTFITAPQAYAARLTALETMVRGDGNDDATDSNFLTNWENMTTITVSGVEKPVYLPWHMGAECNMPDGIRYNVSKAKGWEMAFCELNDPSATSHRYFALYNKYVGQLRVFVWINTQTDFGNKVVFRVALGGAGNTVKYPFYNALEFGVPTNHVYRTNLQPNITFVKGINQEQSFECLISPYKYDNSLSKGWMAFDIDMTGYVPEGVSWRDVQNPDTNPLLVITPEFSETTTINMTGNLKGSASGTFSDPQYLQQGGENNLAGIATMLGALAGACDGNITSNNQYWMLQNNPTASGFAKGKASVLSWAGLGFSAASMVLPLIGTTTPTTFDTIPGKIDLSLNATLDLTGYLETSKSSDLSPFNVGKASITRGNTDKGHMGKGIWSLAEEPVIYISKEDLLSTATKVNLDVVDDNGTMQCGSFNNLNVRLVSFLDPSSIKVNLNTSLFTDIKNINVTATYGVYTDRDLGHTDLFRQFLTIDSRPGFSLNSGAKKGDRITLSTTSNPKLHYVENSDVVGLDSSYVFFDKCSLVDQKVGNLHFFGTNVDYAGTQIMADPMVYVPYKEGDASVFTVYNPVAPDFVVSVSVSFSCKEGDFYFTKRFLPRIELIGHRDLETQYQALKAFSEKCSHHQTTGTLANDASKPVTSVGMQMTLSKTIEMLDIIK